MPKLNAWAAFLSGRDPDPPVEPAVLLMGVAPLDPAINHLDARCPVCKGSIRPQDERVHCLQCDLRPPIEVILRAARQHTRRPPKRINQGPAPATKNLTRKDAGP